MLVRMGCRVDAKEISVQVMVAVKSIVDGILDISAVLKISKRSIMHLQCIDNAAMLDLSGILVTMIYQG